MKSKSDSEQDALDMLLDFWAQSYDTPRFVIDRDGNSIRRNMSVYAEGVVWLYHEMNGGFPSRGGALLPPCLLLDVQGFHLIP